MYAVTYGHYCRCHPAMYYICRAYAEHIIAECIDSDAAHYNRLWRYHVPQIWQTHVDCLGGVCKPLLLHL